MFKHIRREVYQKSNHAQTPWESTSLTAPFVFNPVQTRQNTKPAADDPSIAFYNPSQQLRLKNELSMVKTKVNRKRTMRYVSTSEEFELAEQANSDLFWHASALTLGAISLYSAWDAKNKYDHIKQRNNDLYDEYQTATILQKQDIQKEIESNNHESNEYHQRNILSLTVAMIGIGWELYLLNDTDPNVHMISKSTDPEPSLHWRFLSTPNRPLNLAVSLRF